MDGHNLDSLIEEVADLIVDSKKIVLFTGAGVSTESGIPDFRSPGGIWERYNPNDFTYQKFVGDPEARKLQWRMLREGLGLKAEPNPAHYAIVELYKRGKLDCVITQNVDNLHQRAGMPSDKVLELHGNMQRVKCLRCSRYYPFADIVARIEVGDESPNCEACGGMLKPDAVLFGEALPQDVLEEATQRSYHCHLFIVVGSTLVVYPAAFMPRYAVQSGARLVIINLSPTPMDKHAVVVIRAKAGEVMPEIVERVKAKMGVS